MTHTDPWVHIPVAAPRRRRTSVGRRIGCVLLALALFAGGVTGLYFVGRNGEVPIAGTVGVMPNVGNANAAGVPSQVAPAPSESASPTPSPSPSGPPAYLSATTPTAGVGEHRTRLLPAVTPPPGTGGYQFLTESDTGQAPQYDPCRPIHYVIRDHDTPDGGDHAILEAVQAVSAATGLEFVYDGTTTERPDWNRARYQPKRYGDRWAPVLIAWTDPTESPDMGAGVAGRGGSESFITNVAEAPVYVTGQIQLDETDFHQMQYVWNAHVLQTAIIEHELGHVVGLAHVNDPSQLMYANNEGETGYGPGDLRGLAIAGSGACHPEI